MTDNSHFSENSNAICNLKSHGNRPEPSIFNTNCTNTINSGQWSDNEQRKLIEGVIMYGLKRNSRQDKQTHVKTRNISQIISKTQKFFINIKKAVLKLGSDQNSPETLKALSEEFIKKSCIYGVSDEYLRLFKKKEKDFHKYFIRIFKDIIPTNSINSNNEVSQIQAATDLFKYKYFEQESSINKEVSMLPSSTHDNSNKIFNLFINEAINDSLTSDQIPEFNFPLHSEADNNQSEVRHEPFESIDYFQNSEVIIKNLKGHSNDTLLFDNFADNLQRYLQLSNPKCSYKVEPQYKKLTNRVYKKYVVNHCKGLNLRKLEFLNDINFTKKNLQNKEKLRIENDAQVENDEEVQNLTNVDLLNFQNANRELHNYTYNQDLDLEKHDSGLFPNMSYSESDYNKLENDYNLFDEI